MANKFKVGDKVKSERYGKGYIAEIDDCMYLVVHDEENQRLHDGNNGKRYPKNRCWWHFEGAIEKIDFNKDDLQTGDVVTTRNETKLRLEDSNFTYISGVGVWLDYLSELTDDLKCIDHESSDIIKVERPTYTTVFERDEEVKEMTIAEISKALGYEVKIVKEEER